MIKNFKKVTLALSILLFIIVLTGCDVTFKQLTGSRLGDMEVTIQIPKIFNLQSVTDEITPEEISVTLIQNGSQVATDTKSVNGNTIVFSFTDLKDGSYNIGVFVNETVNTDVYTIYEGSTTATIIRGQTESVVVDLKLTPGDLKVEFMIPEELTDVAFGVAWIENYYEGEDDLVAEIVINGQSGIASFSSLPANSWDIFAGLEDSTGEIVAIGGFEVIVLPGRVNEYSYTLKI